MFLDARKAAAEALGKLGSAGFEPPVVALSDPVSELRVVVAKSLGKTRDPRAAEILITTALKDQSASLINAVEEALAAVAWRPLTPEQRIRTALATGRYADAWKEGKPALHLLLELLENQNEHARVTAAFALGKIGDADAVNR